MGVKISVPPAAKEIYITNAFGFASILARMII